MLLDVPLLCAHACPHLPARACLVHLQEEAASAAPQKGGLLSSFVRSIGVNVVGTQVCRFF